MTVLLGSALATVAGAQAPVAPDWMKVETAHFAVYGSPGSAATEVARQLETFDALLTRLHADLVDARRRPLPVLLFAGPDALGTYLTLSGRERRLSDADLLFRADGTRPLVALDGSRWQQTSRLVRRTYADSRLDAHPRARPWLRTGLVEYYAMAEIQGDAVILGEPNEAHVELLKDSRWIAMEDLLAADRESPLLRGPRRRALFAAQAWLLVHWLQHDPDGERQARLADVAGPVHRATVIEPAELDSRTPTGQAIEDALRAWLGGDLPTTLVEVGPDQALPQPIDVPEVEVGYRLGTLLATQRRLDEAETHFRAGIVLSPDSWMPYDGLGLLEVSRQRWADARDAFDDAITRKPTDPAPFLAYGMATFHGLGQRGRRPAARLAFEQALALDPSLLDAYAGLSMLAYGKRDWTESARWAGRGLQVDPGDGRLRALLGRAQLATGDFDHAMLNAQIALQECDDLDSCTMAQALYRATASRF